MRGDDSGQPGVFSYISAEERVPLDHPLRPIREMVDKALKELSPLFESLYSRFGRPSIAPEKLLRALLIQVLYTVRSERMLMEQLNYNLLFRWFVGLNMEDPIWDATVFSKNRDRLLEGDVARAFFAKVMEEARRRGLLSDEHFTVDGTLIEANASMKSFRKKGDGPPEGGGRNSEADFRGQKRKNQTHESRTDPEAKLYRKGAGKPSQICYLGHVLMENRNGLCTDAVVTQANGTAEPEAALRMVRRTTDARERRVTLGADKGYDVADFQVELVEEGIVPHIAQKADVTPLVDRRTTGRSGYQMSQRVRKRVEEIFGWVKTVGSMRKTRHRGMDRVGWVFQFTVAAYNLVRMRNLSLATA
jgi:transposase